MVALAGAVFIGLAVEVVLGRGIVGFDVALRDALREHGRGPLGLAARLFTDVLSPTSPCCWPWLARWRTAGETGDR